MKKVTKINEFDKLMLHLGLDRSPMYEHYREMAVLRELKKYEKFYDVEDKSRYIYFLVSGVLRGFLIDKHGRDFTDCFIFRYGQAHIGFLDAGLQHIASECAEAIVDSQLICFDIDQLTPYLSSSLELSNLYNRKLQYSNSCSPKCKNLLRYGGCAGTCGFNYWYSFCPYANFCNESEYHFLD